MKGNGMVSKEEESEDDNEEQGADGGHDEADAITRMWT